jgi:hypothetical protein
MLKWRLGWAGTSLALDELQPRQVPLGILGMISHHDAYKEQIGKYRLLSGEKSISS